MLLTCFLCPKEFVDVNEYTSHLRNVHLLFEPCFLRCNVGGCLRTFRLYKVLRRHMRNDHSDAADTHLYAQTDLYATELSICNMLKIMVHYSDVSLFRLAI